MDKYLQKKLYDNDGAVKLLETKKGLCRDYSNLTTALLRAVKIEAKTVIGQAGITGNMYGHAWNEVKVGHKWFSIDTTWDAGVIRNKEFVPKFSQKYFDMNQNEFNKTHVKTSDVY
jgi:transglutaminase-like putative cysteine protease